MKDLGVIRSHFLHRISIYDRAVDIIVLRTLLTITTPSRRLYVVSVLSTRVCFKDTVVNILSNPNFTSSTYCIAVGSLLEKVCGIGNRHAGT